MYSVIYVSQNPGFTPKVGHFQGAILIIKGFNFRGAFIIGRTLICAISFLSTV